MKLRQFILLAAFAIFLEGQARGGWFTYHPAGSSRGHILQEVLSRCPGYGLAQIRKADRATQCHEATHFINGVISHLHLKSEYGAFYVGDGYCFIVQPPQVTVGMVAQQVPSAQRTALYNLYLSREREGRNCLALLDEWTCYTNDAKCTKELKLPADGGLNRASEFCGIVDVLVQTVKQREPNYDTKELEEFVAWQKLRVARLSGQVSNNSESLFSGDPQIMDLAPELRELNTDGSCVHCSTGNLYWWLGEYARAQEYINCYHGGEDPNGHVDKLNTFGARYAVTTTGDESLLEWAIANRRGAGVTWSPNHFINLVGRENGQAVLMGNSQRGIREFYRQPWPTFLQEWRNQGGWAVVILDGVVPPAVPMS